MRHLYGEKEEERFVLCLYLFYLDAVTSCAWELQTLVCKPQVPVVTGIEFLVASTAPFTPSLYSSLSL